MSSTGDYRDSNERCSRNSQEERVSILQMALTHKGVNPSSANHYALDAVARSPAVTQDRGSASTTLAAPIVTSDMVSSRRDEEVEDGVYL